MPTTRNPRRGSLQFWPRKRAERMTARIRTWAPTKDAKLLGFAGYKAGMTHAIIVDNRANSITKGEEITTPVTIVECPPIKIVAINGYKNTYDGKQLLSQVWAEGLDKNVAKAYRIPKKHVENKLTPETLVMVRVLAATQPSKSGLKHKPELIELAIGGSIADQLNKAKELLGKEIPVQDVLAEGQTVDSHAITQGKGLQGPVKRFGVDIRQHKSEKTKRGPGNVGPWNGNRSWTVSHAGQMGFQQRTELNKVILKIAKPEEVNPDGGFLHYGIAKHPCLLVKGSLPCPAKRLVTFTHPVRSYKPAFKQAPAVSYISQASKQ